MQREVLFTRDFEFDTNKVICYPTQYKPFISKISRRLLILFLYLVDRLIHISNNAAPVYLSKEH